jgi:hypothetical protein
VAANKAAPRSVTLRDEIEAALRVVRPRLPVAGNRYVHETRVAGRQRGVVEAECSHHTRAAVFRENVCRIHQPRGDLAPLRGFEIQHDAALSPVDRVVGRRVTTDAAGHPAGHVAFRRLDLDDVGAQIGEEHRTERPRHDLRDIDHANARQRPAGHRLHAGYDKSYACLTPKRSSRSNRRSLS